MDEQKLKICLFSLWNNSISRQHAQEEIGRLLSKRTPRRLYRDLHKRRKNGDRNVPMDTFVMTCALFCRGQDTSTEIDSAIQAYDMEQMLFIGYRIFLLNEIKKIQFRISWTDQTYPNQHGWLSRFAGSFHDRKYWELLSVALLLYKSDRTKLWAIAKEDPNDLIFLNWTETFGEFPSTDMILELLEPTQSKRRQALAFWWFTFPIQGLRGADEQAASILAELVGISDTVLVPRLYEYLLYARDCPQIFQTYLAKSRRDLLLKQEIQKEELIQGWREASLVASLIKKVTNKRRQNFYWRILLSNIENKLKVGHLNYSIDQSQLFLPLLPEKYLTQFQERIDSWCKTLHTAVIDFMVRPQVYQHDSALEATAKAILNASPTTVEHF